MGPKIKIKNIPKIKRLFQPNNKDSRVDRVKRRLLSFHLKGYIQRTVCFWRPDMVAQTENMKRCSKCREWKDRSEFHKLKTGKDGLHPRCKACAKEYQKEYYKDHRVETLTRVKIRSQSPGVKEAIKEYQKNYQRSEAGKIRDKQYAVGYRATHTTPLDRLKTRWWALNQRCNNPNNIKYPHYGGRGIKCLFGSFDEFYRYATEDLEVTSVDMIRGHDIHRIDPDGHYEPGNIEFLTPKEHRDAHKNSRS